MTQSQADAGELAVLLNQTAALQAHQHAQLLNDLVVAQSAAPYGVTNGVVTVPISGGQALGVDQTATATANAIAHQHQQHSFANQIWVQEANALAQSLQGVIGCKV